MSVVARTVLREQVKEVLLERILRGELKPWRPQHELMFILRLRITNAVSLLAIGFRMMSPTKIATAYEFGFSPFG